MSATIDVNVVDCDLDIGSTRLWYEVNAVSSRRIRLWMQWRPYHATRSSVVATTESWAASRGFICTLRAILSSVMQFKATSILEEVWSESADIKSRDVKKWWGLEHTYKSYLMLKELDVEAVDKDAFPQNWPINGESSEGPSLISR